jgi:hypothetical protein
VPDIGTYNDDDESGGEEIEGEGSEQEIEGKLSSHRTVQSNEVELIDLDDEELEEEAEEGE